MKKRSLVAAVAMLVVSAIVLTSATYAWFAANSTATVSTMEAAVANNDGSLQVKATLNAVSGSTWKVALSSADYTGYTETLAPVSMSIATGAGDPTFYKATYDGVSFSAGPNGNASDYLTYGFDVQYVNANDSAKNINLTPTFSDDSGFCYALVEVAVGGNSTFYMLGGSSYTPVTGITASTVITDAKGEGASVDIIDANDDGYANATMGVLTGATQQSSGSAITFEAAASKTTTANVTVYIWAEGQDAQCSGTTAAGNASVSFAIAAVA